MTLTQLLNRKAWLVRVSDSGEEDEYGNQKQGETTTEIVCEVQQRRRDEQPDGSPAEGDWLGVFPAGTVVDSGDKIVVEGLGEFELIGDSWAARNPRTQTESHVEATLRRVAGSESGS